MNEALHNNPSSGQCCGPICPTFLKSLALCFYRELSSTFARLCHLVDSTTSEMEQEMKQLDQEISTLEELSGAAKLLKNKANYLINELNMFDKAYLTEKS